MDDGVVFIFVKKAFLACDDHPGLSWVDCVNISPCVGLDVIKCVPP